MKVCVIGTGYVGLVTGVCLAEIEHNVICVDKDESKINMLLNGKMPIYEPGLDKFVEKNVKKKNLIFSSDVESAIKSQDIIFICVGTPPTSAGKPDLNSLDEVSKLIGKSINSYKVIINKSTVPIGTAKRIKKIIKENLSEENKNNNFDIVSNPEFLKEGEAVEDAFFPERIVFGSDNEKVINLMKKLYEPIINQDFDYANNNPKKREKVPIIITDSTSSELIKYASNAFLATKISFVNEVANICERVGANILDVTYGMGLDSRIGTKYMKAGIGWGGSCFPKDVRALSFTAEEYGAHASILNAVIQVNNYQRFKIIQKAMDLLGIIEDKIIGVLGIAFKPNTDDTREAPSVTVINKLVELGAEVRAYDPVVTKIPPEMDQKVIISKDPYETLKNANLMVLVTDWVDFLDLDFVKIKQIMKNPYIIDGRNFLEKKKLLDLGFVYRGIGY
ncbi:MAG: UDP-glucose/GDP-mannose dehydrogenase family protein [Actinobacteria bacterium]|nr:UDP-glucose/GDP-mannose dehydrogenase family protein [Actinomycetota bacterium]MBU4451130.1 UDP-glucose/GDP-mannose dehydrogenase family protein [Actinomycetota bacterium]MCG2788639.1 UDP-glucose/GDP-mannose dehydrogenase family protein [Actinomycetes bacterium]